MAASRTSGRPAGNSGDNAEGRGLLVRLLPLLLPRPRDQPHRLLDPRRDLLAHVGMLRQERLGVLPALADLVPLEEVSGPRLHDDAPLGDRVEQRPLLGDAVPLLYVARL